MSSDHGVSPLKSAAAESSDSALNTEIHYYESKKVSKSLCLEHLDLYKQVVKAMGEKSLGKKCYAIEMGWFRSFENYGNELL